MEKKEEMSTGKVGASWLQRGSFRSRTSSSPWSYTRWPPLHWEMAFGGSCSSLQAYRRIKTTVEALVVVIAAVVAPAAARAAGVGM